MFHKPSILRCAIVSACLTSFASAQPLVEILNSFPRRQILDLSLIGRDGYLYGSTSATSGPQGGAIVRAAPGTPIQYLHRFPASAGRNTGGANAAGQLIMGTDGYLHGLASSGGSVGQGVLYRLRPDGREYTAIDLDGSKLPAGSYDSQLVADNSLLIENYGLTFLFTSDNGSLILVRTDGSLSLILSWPRTTAVFQVPSGQDETINIHTDRNLLLSTEDGSGVRVRIKSGENQSRWLRYSGPLPIPLQAVKNGLISFVPDTSGKDSAGYFTMTPTSPGTGGTIPTRLGSVSISQFPDGDMKSRFITASDDGTVCFTAGASVAGGGGSTLLSLPPSGPAKILAGFEGGTLHGWASRTSGEACGSTESSRIYVPHDDSNQWSSSWMDASKSASYDVVPGRRNTGSWFRIFSDTQNFFDYPVANIDVVKPKRAGTITVDPFANDKDTVGRPLILSGLQAESANGAFRQSNSVATFIPDFTGAGGRAHYVASVAEGQGSSYPAIGTIVVEENHSGVYVSPDFQVRNRSMQISVNASGRFTTVVPNDAGKPVPATGTLGNPALIRISPTETLRLTISEVSTSPPASPSSLYFTAIFSSGGKISGYANLK